MKPSPLARIAIPAALIALAACVACVAPPEPRSPEPCACPWPDFVCTQDGLCKYVGEHAESKRKPKR